MGIKDLGYWTQDAVEARLKEVIVEARSGEGWRPGTQKAGKKGSAVQRGKQVQLPRLTPCKKRWSCGWEFGSRVTSNSGVKMLSSSCTAE
jgi:hypothetical protein